MPSLRQLVRYTSASAVSTAVGLCVLGALVGFGALGAGWANVIATACGTVPSFELNRRWVWGRRGRRSLWAEMGPFAIWSFAGLGLSTAAVHVAAGWAAGRAWSPAGRTVAALAANVGAYGVLWVAQFVLLDRLLFRGSPNRPPPARGRQVGFSLQPSNGITEALRASGSPPS